MGAHWWWWGLAVALTAFELTTGTLFLLVLALGAGAGGVAAFAGGGSVMQVMVAAIVSLVGWVLLRRLHPRRPRGPVQGNRDVHLDIGTRVHVERWQPGGVCRVQYRGASWEAIIAPGSGAEPQPGDHEIRAIDGNRLVLAPLATPGP